MKEQRDKQLLIVQIGFYLGYLGLVFVLSGIYPAVYIIKLVCISVSFVIKLYRQTRRMTWTQLLQIQLQYYVVYLLTAFQLVFSYQVTSLIISTPLIIVSFLITIVSKINYSLLTNSKTITVYEFVIYSIGIISQMCINAKATVFTIQKFSQIQNGDYLKDFLLLSLSTIITIGVLILEKIFKSWKQSRSFKNQTKKLNQIEMQLNQTVNTQ